MSIFTGAGVALVTPMNADGTVNYDKLEELVQYQIENGTDAIIICGTTGEASTLTEEEHLEVIGACVEFTRKRVPVVAGTGSNCTETAVKLSVEAKKKGVDGLLLVTPYYNKATQKGIALHFKTIAETAALPVILYNIPGRTGCGMTPATIAGLFRDVKYVVGLKEASGNISHVAQVMNLTDGELDVYSGNDDQIVPILSLGGKGVISVLSHVAPRDTHDIVAKYLAGDTKEAVRLQLKYLPLINALFSEVNPIPVKKALDFMGMEPGPVRLPLTEMEPEHAELLRQEMIKAGVIK